MKASAVVDARAFTTAAEILVRAQGSGFEVGTNIKLHRRPKRPAVVLAPGHHVQAADRIIFLLVAPILALAADMRGASPRAIVLPLERFSAAGQAAFSSSASSSLSSSKRHATFAHVEFRHPVSGLRWFQRAPLSQLKIIEASTIVYLVHVTPAFTVADGDTGEDGYLLNHGIFNYSVRHPDSPR